SCAFCSSMAAAETARAEQKAHGKKVGHASPEERPALLESAGALKQAVKDAEESEKTAAAEVDRLQRLLSNVVEEGTPAGGEDDFVEIERIGQAPTFDFEPKDHLELGESLGLLDMERGAKVSGARFYF